MMFSQASQSGFQSSQQSQPCFALHFRLFKPQKHFQNEKIYLCGSISQLGGMLQENSVCMKQLSDGIFGFDLQLPGEFSIDNFQYTFYVLGQEGENLQLFKWDGQCDTKVENKIGNFHEFLFENLWNGMGIQQQLPGQQVHQKQGLQSFQEPLQQQNLTQGFQQPQFQEEIQATWPRELQTQSQVSPFVWYSQAPVQQAVAIAKPVEQAIQQPAIQQVQQPSFQQKSQMQTAPLNLKSDQFGSKGFDQKLQQQGVKRRDIEMEKLKTNRWDDQARNATDKLIQNLEKSRNKLDLLDPSGFNDLYSYSDDWSKDSIKDQRKQWIFRYRDLLDSSINQARNLRMEIYRISPKNQEQTGSTGIKEVVYGAVETVGNVASTVASAAMHPITTTEKVAETALHTGQSMLNTMEDKLGFVHPTRETKAV